MLHAGGGARSEVGTFLTELFCQQAGAHVDILEKAGQTIRGMRWVYGYSDAVVVSGGKAGRPLTGVPQRDGEIAGGQKAETAAVLVLNAALPTVADLQQAGAVAPDQLTGGGMDVVIDDLDAGKTG